LFEVWLAAYLKLVYAESHFLWSMLLVVCGGFPSINEIGDLTAGLLSEVCCDVGVEPARS